MDTEDWHRLYRTLAEMDIPPPTTPVTIQPKPGKPNVELPIGWEDMKIGISFEHSAKKAFEKAGWVVLPMTSSVAQALPAALAFIDTLKFAHIMKESEMGAEQSVSKTEQKVLEKVLQNNLPVPDRNLEIRNEDGELLTIPDFVWEDIKFAVFVDGHHWHGGKSLEDLMHQVQSDPKRRQAIKERWKNKSAQDADARRWMTANGWAVIAVSDKTVDDGKDVLDKAVNEIVTTYKMLMNKNGGG